MPIQNKLKELPNHSATPNPQSYAVPKPLVTPQVTAQSYNDADLACMYAESCEFTEWLATLITQAKNEINEIKANLSTNYNVDECHFYTLDKLLGLSEFLADDRVATLERLHKNHAQEWKAQKGGV